MILTRIQGTISTQSSCSFVMSFASNGMKNNEVHSFGGERERKGGRNLKVETKFCFLTFDDDRQLEHNSPALISLLTGKKFIFLLGGKKRNAKAPITDWL